MLDALSVGEHRDKCEEWWKRCLESLHMLTEPHVVGLDSTTKIKAWNIFKYALILVDSWQSRLG